MTYLADNILCPLCNQGAARLFFKDDCRDYFQCGYCRLVFVPKSHWLSRDDEKAVYDLHENNELDRGYRRFLSRLTKPMLERLPPHQKGLDFGCGPGPALSVILKEAGHQVSLYDPFYFNHPSLLEQTYDFITATEVVEHLHHPARVFTSLFEQLNPGGWLGVMTKQVIDQQAFATWHYIRDLTHICFYSQPTFEYIARKFKADLFFEGNDVILFNKRQE